MKKSIKATALFLLLSVGVFASTTKKDISNTKAAVTQQVSFAGSKDLSLNINTSATSMVRIYDQDQNLLLSDRVEASKAYNLSQLDNGAYTFKIVTGKQEVVKKVVVYQEDNQKGFFIMQ